MSFYVFDTLKFIFNNSWFIKNILFLKVFFNNILDTFVDLKPEILQKNLETKVWRIFFFDKKKQYSFIQIDRVHRYNENR